MSLSIFKKFDTTWMNLNILGRRLYSDDASRLTTPHKVDQLEKRFLVWTGKYKTLEEVPPYVSQTVMERSRNRMRIKIANYMIVATLLGCITMVYLGKQDHKEGKSVQKQNLEWHRKIKEEDEKTKAAATQN